MNLFYNKAMSRRNKKRTKKYSGEDAKQFNQPISSEPVVHRYTAVERSRAGQWWFEKKRFVKPVGITVLVILLVVWMIYELINLAF